MSASPMTSWIDTTGYAAAFLTTVSFLPQVVRIWRTKKSDDLSLPAFSAFSLGVLCWLVYGIAKGMKPVIAANVVTLFLALAVLILAWRYRTRPGG